MAKESDIPLTKNSNKMKTNKTNNKMTTMVDSKYHQSKRSQRPRKEK